MEQVQRCLSYKADGFICNTMTNGGHRCGVHLNQYNRNIDRYGEFLENQCEIVKNGRKCPHAKIEGSLICQRHSDAFREMRMVQEERQRERAARDQERRDRDARVNTLVELLRARNPRPTWQAVVEEMYEHFENGDYTREIAYLISRVYAAREIVIWPPNLIDQYWSWIDDGRVGEAPQLQQLPQFDHVPAVPRRAAPAAPRLQALARDTQNVHTREVSEQTNESTKKLLEEYERSCKTKRFRSPDWFAAKWLTERYGTWGRVVRVVTDMQHWYGTRTCRTENDWLYTKCLDGLYMVIKRTTDEEARKELYKRAFEECEEAVGMCCEGHLSRLCNVMVGFDESFKPPVPIGELLQNAMAKIAQSEQEANDKIAEATKVFNELNVPEPERVVWLEALEGY
jgi:ATP-dependent DNA ligase